jgi:uncharacterized protein
MSCIINETDLRDQLLKDNSEFRRLVAEHQSCDHQLDDLLNKHFLNEEERLQEKTLKKKKLMLKDQIYSMVQKFRREINPGSY